MIVAEFSPISEIPAENPGKNRRNIAGILPISKI
jgi:hypothetical protein